MKDFFLKIALAQSNESIGEFKGNEIYSFVDSMGWLGIFIKGVFWVMVIMLVVVSAIALNKYFGKRKDNIYLCHRCGYAYREKEWAQKCEAWCTRHKTCNLEINEHRILYL
jgi:hypothetical protein